MRALQTPVLVLITNLDHQLRNNPTQAPRGHVHQQHPSHRYRLAPDTPYKHRYRHRYRHCTQAHTAHSYTRHRHVCTLRLPLALPYPVGTRSRVSHLVLVRRILDLRPRPEFSRNRRCVDRPIFLRSRPRQSPRYPYFSPYSQSMSTNPVDPFSADNCDYEFAYLFRDQPRLPRPRIFDVSLRAQSQFHPPPSSVHGAHSGTSETLGQFACGRHLQSVVANSVLVPTIVLGVGRPPLELDCRLPLRSRP